MANIRPHAHCIEKEPVLPTLSNTLDKHNQWLPSPACLGVGEETENAAQQHIVSLDDVKCASLSPAPLSIMPIVAETDELIMMRHSDSTYSTPDHVDVNSPTCPMGMSFAVYDKELQHLVCVLSVPHMLEGVDMPQFDQSFTLSANIRSHNCCHRLYSSEHVPMETKPKKRICFKYNNLSCPIFLEYQGIHLALLKYKGRVYLMSNGCMDNSNTDLGHDVATCLGVHCLDELFDATMPYSMHVMFFTYCWDMNHSIYGKPIVGPFLVYMSTTRCPFETHVDNSQLGGRLPIERNVCCDRLCRVLGGRGSRLIVPSLLSKLDVTVLWNLGCTLRLTNMQDNTVIVVKQA